MNTVSHRGTESSPQEREFNHLSSAIVGAAMTVHSTMGPGLLESVYEGALAHELGKLGHRVQRQVPVEVVYDGISLGEGFRMDLLVDGKIVVELKSCEETHPIHAKQVLTYLKLSNHRLGLLINFGKPLIKDGITRLIHGTLS
jgi:GxxExxY protein